MNKQQLAAKIWESANRMRGKVDASEYKDFILGFIFYKYLSEKEEQFFLGEGMTAADTRARPLLPYALPPPAPPGERCRE